MKALWHSTAARAMLMSASLATGQNACDVDSEATSAAAVLRK